MVGLIFACFPLASFVFSPIVGVIVSGHSKLLTNDELNIPSRINWRRALISLNPRFEASLKKIPAEGVIGKILNSDNYSLLIWQDFISSKFQTQKIPWKFSNKYKNKSVFLDHKQTGIDNFFKAQQWTLIFDAQIQLMHTVWPNLSPKRGHEHSWSYLKLLLEKLTFSICFQFEYM